MCINSIKYSGELGLLFAYYLFISPKSIKHLKSLHVLGNTFIKFAKFLVAHFQCGYLITIIDVYMYSTVSTHHFD